MAGAQGSRKVKCLVTGGAGFLGKHLVQALLDSKQYDVTILDIRDVQVEGCRSLAGDLRNPEVVQKAVQGMPIVSNHSVRVLWCPAPRKPSSSMKPPESNAVHVKRQPVPTVLESLRARGWQNQSEDNCPGACLRVACCPLLLSMEKVARGFNTFNVPARAFTSILFFLWFSS